MQISTTSAGYKWISDATGVKPTQSFRVSSTIGSHKSTQSHNGFTQNIYPKSYEPEATLRGHLTFAMKYEGVDLDFLARLFAAAGPQPIEQWVKSEPTSAYARQYGFLYEWLTNTTLSGIGDAGGNYVDLLDEKKYLVATKPDKVRRWRINNNLPGTREFCPLIAKTPGMANPEQLTQEINSLVAQFGVRTVERAVNWLTIKESRASFAIESEGREEGRIRRLAAAMSTHCGRIDSALTEEGMTEIQSAIMGGSSTGFKLGTRRSPIFVGHTTSLGQPIIDYLAPHHEDVPMMMEGLREYEARTRGQSPILRAAALSYGLVYIHPLRDGNGRLSRFLINDILRRDKFLPAPMILPVSAVISESAASRHQYDASLERLSRPLMTEIKVDCEFGAITTYSDGVKSNLAFDQWDRSRPTWRYPDLTFQALYLSQVIERAVTHGVKQEALYLQRYDLAVERLKQMVEGADTDYAAIIRSITQNEGVSGKLRKTYPTVFTDTKLSNRITKEILCAFEIKPTEDDGEEDEVEPNYSLRPRQS